MHVCRHSVSCVRIKKTQMNLYLALALVSISILCLGCHGQTSLVRLIYSSSDCSGNAVIFSASINVTGIRCISVPCAVSGNGAGSQLYTCVDTQSPIPPNSIVCPTCSYCGGRLYSGTTTCTVTPTNGASLSAIGFTALGKCVPITGGLYRVWHQCGSNGIVANATSYTDSMCTIEQFTPPSVSGPLCVPGSPVCSASPQMSSTDGLCVYYTGNNTANGSSATFSAVILCVVIAMVSLFV